MKLLVTGGVGYIGGVVARQLAEAGHKVTILDRRSPSPQQRQANPSIVYVEGDIANIAHFFSVDDHIDAVLHFGALIAAGESVIKPELYWENNTIGSFRLLEALRKLGIRKLIFSSTAAVYGNPETVPITEEARKNPTNPYGMSKLAVDMMIASECQAYGLAATSLRYFNVAGAYEDIGENHFPETHIIPLLLATAAGVRPSFTIYGTDYPTEDGTCIRDYIHVSDLALAHILALKHPAPGKHAIYNLGNGQGFSNKEAVSTVERVTSKKLSIEYGPRREGDPAILIASSSAAKRELGWKPQKPQLETIIQDAWNFYQRQKYAA